MHRAHATIGPDGFSEQHFLAFGLRSLAPGPDSPLSPEPLPSQTSVMGKRTAARQCIDAAMVATSRLS
jgi:hypothetical protein